MKYLRRTATMAALAAAIILHPLSGAIYAFHEGGEGYCEGCHDVHQSPSNDDQTVLANPFLLRGPDASSTCLLCHAEAGKYYNVYSWDGSQYTPGGDFYWLEKTFTAMVEGEFYISEGENHGHNIVAVDYGLHQDGRNSVAPGDSYPSHAMSCISCHDPHDQTVSDGTAPGNYRLLGGDGYSGGSRASVLFVYPAPVAVASMDWTETDSNHTAYGSGMSEWCGNCHGSLLYQPNKHPSGDYVKLSGEIAANYNSYITTGNVFGAQSTAYLALVPFELGTRDLSGLSPSSTAGPSGAGNANVMCLTCHRAHASAFENIGRWDFHATFLVDSHPRLGDGGVTGNDVRNSYYGRYIISAFGPYQRQLCNKCHFKD